MGDDEFLAYCDAHADTPRCGFVPSNLARLLRLAGKEDAARHWDGIPLQVVDCSRKSIKDLVAAARARATPPQEPPDAW